ncbi:type II toxin-antitoxin system RelE/ParE family toxin [Emticicia fontis]
MREVVITDIATEDIENVSRFLQNNYSNKVKLDFLVRLSEKLLLIERMPFMYPVSFNNPRVRRCVIHKNVVCFYEVDDEKIYILSITDTRIDPKSSRF